MCDQDHFEDDLKKYSRRDMGALTAAGIGAAFLLPRAADAAEVTGRDVSIETSDGQCDAYFVAPRSGSHAAVLIWPDIFGLRPAFRQMAKRLAESGYSVLVVNPFYRTQPAPTAKKGANTPIGDVRPLARSLDATKHTTDAKAFVAWLDTQPEVDTSKKSWHDGLLHGRPDCVAYCGSGTGSCGGGGHIPWRGIGY